MGRVSKEESIRVSGAQWALRVAKEHGVEALEADLKKRGAQNIPLQVNHSDLVELTEVIKVEMVKPLLSLMLVTLHDEFGFGHERLTRCMERFEQKASCIVEDYTTWNEQAEILLHECGIELKER